jgi:hypothetical protein
MRLIALAVLAISSTVAAEPGGRCEGGVCDVDDGPRPWVLSDSCHEDHDVVGYHRCPAFDWGRAEDEPDVSVEAGIGWRHVVAPAVPAMAATRTASGSAPLADIATSELRIAVGLGGFYGGVELAVGDLTRRTYPFGAFVQGGVVAGAQLPLGPIVLGAELLGGGRSERLTHNINNNKAPAVTSGVVEGAIGSSVVDRRERMATLGVVFHSRSYAAQR